jgi:outer membrane lipoprotein-sorting protein
LFGVLTGKKYIMKKILLLFLAVSAIHLQVLAQTPAPTEKNDQQAKKALDKVRKKYDGYKTLEATFSLVIELPGQQKEVQKGNVGQEGDKFRLEMDQQIIVNDTKTTWVYLKKNNEVQINNSEKGGGENDFLTPKELLSRYQKGDFLYAIVDKKNIGGKVITQIEFKPKDKKSDYSKLRVSLDEKLSTIEEVKAFAKDGSHYTFTINKLTPNKKFAATYFTFDTKKYPGIKVEDLRM